MLRAGVAVRAVDVPVGTPLAGFAGRLSASTGVHDPTTVRALVLDDVAVVSVDVCVLHEQTCAAIEKASGLAAVVVAATHTHSGPSVGCGRVGPHSAAVHDAIVDAAGAALREAADARVPVEVSWASVTGTGVAKDRRHLDRMIDPPLVALRFTDSSTGVVVATLASYPCHPVVLDATNTLVTADYVHPLRAGVEAETSAPCVFLTGAAGDVNTGHAAAASFASGKAPERTFERAAELGGRLAAGLASAGWERLESSGAVFRSASVTLDYEPLTVATVGVRRDGWQRAVPDADPGTRAVLECWIDWAERWRPEWLNDAWTGRVGCLDLGSALVVTLPGEPFLWASDTLMKRRPHVMVAGYSDGVVGYLPTSDAYPEGGYEVEDACMYYAMPAPFRRGSLERLTDAAAALMGG